MLSISLSSLYLLPVYLAIELSWSRMLGDYYSVESVMYPSTIQWVLIGLSRHLLSNSNSWKECT